MIKSMVSKDISTWTHADKMKTWEWADTFRSDFIITFDHLCIVYPNDYKCLGTAFLMSAIEELWRQLHHSMCGLTQIRMFGVIPVLANRGFSVATLLLLWMPKCLVSLATQCCHWLSVHHFICFCTINLLMAPFFLLRLSQEMNPTSKLSCILISSYRLCLLLWNFLQV